ncbi:hypothetical protein PAXRUDRAFT_622447 [Paxillus rubicundulus Ve08.2h10]|uniref:Uncharacterized protein n=1 Tax=Paxillus rubicundulus Ve08.2h10 TaxID=930991 RepID=A0A0D0BMV2_9AGAM|nr:hypothetical protein PAXRUDRAFT_622447 [Paxillus rubicundulus Ve08.2h10]
MTAHRLHCYTPQPTPIYPLGRHLHLCGLGQCLLHHDMRHFDIVRSTYFYIKID